MLQWSMSHGCGDVPASHGCKRDLSRLDHSAVASCSWLPWWWGVLLPWESAGMTDCIDPVGRVLTVHRKDVDNHWRMRMDGAVKVRMGSDPLRLFRTVCRTEYRVLHFCPSWKLNFVWVFLILYPFTFWTCSLDGLAQTCAFTPCLLSFDEIAQHRGYKDG